MACTDLAAVDYGEVRLALGLSADDTDSLPDAVIAGRLYGGLAGMRMAKAVACCDGLSCESGDDDYDAEWEAYVAAAVVAYTAALLAGGYMAARANERVTSEGLGSLKVTYDRTDWERLASVLKGQAEATLRLACPCAAETLTSSRHGAGVPTLISVDGPTRHQGETGDTIDSRLEWLNPDVTEGLV
mgnify:CR=1 FL=1